jgi:hypothetical protein
MKNDSHRKILLALMALVLIVFVVPSQSIAPASAQSGGAYNLTWNTIDGGGGMNTGGAYIVTGTTGQPDAATVSGGSYTLNGGFWNGVQNLLSNSLHLFLPLIEKGP